MKITLAGTEDLKEIRDNGAAFISASISSRFLSYDGAGFLDILTAMIRAGVAMVWVCRDDEKKLAGAICLILAPNVYNPKENLGDIYFVDVLPEYQKKGVAKMMMLAVEIWAKNNNIVSLSISFKQQAIAERVADSMGYSMFEFKLMKRLNKGD
jgi:GNAT superfamily N-acetyltransferase